MKAFTPTPFTADWPEPDPRYFSEERASPPDLPIREVLSPKLADLVMRAAEAKGAPVDYVFAGLLVTAGSLIGNARWASPWSGWKEPPVLWAALIGKPSMNKSPGLDAVLEPLKASESKLRADAQKQIAEWEKKAEIAKLLENAWKEEAKEAAASGVPISPKPDGANPGPKPELPRLALSDATIEKLASILQLQPKGTLVLRDELAGWLGGMTRYSGGGSDRPFWLESYGGRPYTVERMGRAPVNVERLAISVVGNIQPDRLNTLFLQSDDDGLLARFVPIWPAPAPLSRPKQGYEDSELRAVFERLISLEMAEGEDGHPQPKFLNFTEEAQEALHVFRQKAQDWEAHLDGVLESFLGKLPGLTIRLSVVLAMLEWAVSSEKEPREITAYTYQKATLLAEDYFLPMARRAYANASLNEKERAGRRLFELIAEKSWWDFSSREVRRMQRSGLASQEQVDKAITALLRADIIREVENASTSRGGRPPRRYEVNPALHEGSPSLVSASSDKTD